MLGWGGRESGKKKRERGLEEERERRDREGGRERDR
jgi:hypothetical protein